MSVPKNEIICGDCLEIMKGWPADSIDCCVTSPPYWGLRDYGVEGQLGLEKTPEEFVAKMVRIFQEVKRVLKPEGTLWLNMGDSYNSGLPGSRDPERWPKQSRNDHKPLSRPICSNMKVKDLVGMPWMVAFALRQDGWYLRQDIIWHKPNPMPESVRDRCTKAHEYIFLLSKSPKYYYDQDAIRIPQIESNDARPRMGQGPNTQYNQKRKSWHDHKDDLQVGNRIGQKEDHPAGKNKRDVWTVPLAPYPEAHFATFPPNLIEPCILAGCPEWICKKCGKARERVVERESFCDVERGSVPSSHRALGQPQQAGVSCKSKTTGWTDCGCGEGFEPGVVLDPFMGSGTTAMVAYENRRNYVGCELNPEYIKLNRADKAKENYALFEG